MVVRVSRAALESRRMLYLYVATGAAFGTIAARGLTVPLYAHQLGASRFAVGALFAVATIAAAILSLPSGVLVDRFGSRTLIAVSLVITAVSLIATAATTTVAPLFLWQILGGLAAGIQQAAFFSAVTESVSRSRLGRAMGWLTFSMQAGFFLGPSAAGLALTVFDVRADTALIAAALIFASPGALVASNTTQRAAKGIGLKDPLVALLRQRTFIQITVGLIGVAATWGTIGAFLPVFGKEALRLPNSQVGYLLGLQAVFNGASRIPAGRIVDRARERWKIVVLGGIVWGLAVIVLGHLTGFLLPAVVLAIGTPFMAAAFVAIGATFGELSNKSTRGVTMGMYGTVLFGGLSAGPLIFGPIVQNAGYAAGFTACAIAAIVLVLAMALFQPAREVMRSERAPLDDSETPVAAARRG